MSYQKIVIVGNLGRDPELRYTPDGKAVTQLNVATSRKWTGSDGQLQKETIWFNVSVWGKQAESCNQWLKKGSTVLVDGRLSPDRATNEPRIYQDKQGNYRASYEITANDVRFLGGGADGETQRESSFTPQQSSTIVSNDDTAITEDEIPF